LGSSDAEVPFTEQTLGGVLERLAAPRPVPGGGAAAALAGALAAALVEMASPAPERERAAALRARLAALADEDAAGYSRVLEAGRLPADDPARPGQLREALSHAAEAPLGVVEAAAEVAASAAGVAAHGRPAVRGDAVTAVLLAEAAARAATGLVVINLEEEPEDPRLARARAGADAAEAAREGAARP
jgi:formiminotetrahydrofolate cyclodeaminase